MRPMLVNNVGALAAGWRELTDMRPLQPAHTAGRQLEICLSTGPVLRPRRGQYQTTAPPQFMQGTDRKGGPKLTMADIYFARFRRIFHALTLVMDKLSFER